MLQDSYFHDKRVASILDFSTNFRLPNSPIISFFFSFSPPPGRALISTQQRTQPPTLKKTSLSLSLASQHSFRFGLVHIIAYSPAAAANQPNQPGPSPRPTLFGEFFGCRRRRRTETTIFLFSPLFPTLLPFRSFFSYFTSSFSPLCCAREVAVCT